MTRRNFTLTEVMIVALIFATIAAVMAPNLFKTLGVGNRIRQIDAIEGAFSNAALRAQLNGREVHLLLEDSEDRQHYQLRIDELLSEEEKDSLLEEEDTFSGRQLFLGEDTYILGKDLQLEDNIEDVFWCFYPDSSASGQPRSFTLGDRYFTLKVDRLSGKLIMDVSDESH